MFHHNLNNDEFRVELARQNKTRVELAAELGIPYSTMSGWLTGRHPAPERFHRQVEVALGLRAGALRPKAH